MWFCNILYQYEISETLRIKMKPKIKINDNNIIFSFIKMEIFMTTFAEIAHIHIIAARDIGPRGIGPRELGAGPRMGSSSRRTSDLPREPSAVGYPTHHSGDRVSGHSLCGAPTQHGEGP